MDEQNQNTAGEGLTAEQQELLTQFATRRAARLAVASGRTLPLTALETRLKEMDAAFASPHCDNPPAQENQ
ncbi:hypothetical protein [Streptomyces tauricus]|uniref:hypothetical protein n=1 Tax=Streptomyces tauricus TaxID=68274 RepID=UPI003810A5A1